MASLRLYPNLLFGRNRDEPEFLAAYINADVGTVSTPTKTDLVVIDQTPGIVHDAVNKEIDLPAGGAYRITVEVDLTGASGYVDIYNETGAAVIASGPVAGGRQTLTAYFRTTVATSISIRIDDVTANTTGAAGTLVLVERMGVVKL